MGLPALTLDQTQPPKRVANTNSDRSRLRIVPRLVPAARPVLITDLSADEAQRLHECTSTDFAVVCAVVRNALLEMQQLTICEGPGTTYFEIIRAARSN